jgi:hypothetical protein
MTEPRREAAQDECMHGDDAMVMPSALIAADLFSQAISYVRPHLDVSLPIGNRLRALWAAVIAARDLAASDVVTEEFMHLARESGLARDLGRHADDDLRHVVRWAMLGRNPFN